MRQGHSREYLFNHEISIHASLAGCDYIGLSESSSTEFQSTHPLRDATYGMFTRQLNIDFNPRIPCGMRPRKTYPYEKTEKFQSTHPLRDATANRYIFFDAIISKFAIFNSYIPIFLHSRLFLVPFISFPLSVLVRTCR